MNAPLHYAAAVLCGGQSVRMGSDKAWLPAPEPGSRPLLQRQLDLLATLDPPSTSRLVSARRDQSLPQFADSIRRVDDAGECGPLGGLVALLQSSNAPHLLVVPVDAPHLDIAVLQRLLAVATAHPNSSIVARSPAGVEPLVAVYPRAIASAFANALAGGRFGLRRLLTEEPVADTVVWVDYPEGAAFTNWNTPDDRTL